MKYLISLFFVMFAFNVKAQINNLAIDIDDLYCNTEDGVIICTDKNFQPFTGLLYSKYTNGMLALKAYYKNGNPDGVAKSYYANGQLEAEVTYQNGKPIGKKKKYHKNGQLSIVGNYKKGEFDGEWRAYYDDGSLQIIGNYKEGLEDGTFTYYSQYGKITREDIYKNGDLINIKTYHENGKLRGEMNLDDSFYTKGFNENGQLETEMIIENQKVIDKKYAPNGKLIYEGDLLETLKHVEHKEFND